MTPPLVKHTTITGRINYDCESGEWIQEGQRLATLSDLVPEEAVPHRGKDGLNPRGRFRVVVEFELEEDKP